MLSALLIRAAGNYNSSPKSTAMQYCVSTYSTTIKSLIFGTRSRDVNGPPRQPTDTIQPERILAVPMQKTLNQQPLNVKEELEAIVANIGPNAILTILDNPTQEVVSSQLNSCRIAHFARHGYSTPLNLSKARLLLTDHETRPLAVSKIGELKLKSTKLAYLLVCHSAVSRGQILANEGINMVSAFRIAGFPSLVGILWQAL